MLVTRAEYPKLPRSACLFWLMSALYLMVARGRTRAVTAPCRLDRGAIRNVLRSGGGSGAGRVLGQDAELVALGIGERNPAAAIRPPVVGQLRCPERDDPLGFLLAGAVGRSQVQVDPVLHRLAVWDGDEEQELAPVSRRDQAFLVTWLVRVVRIFEEVQNL